MDWGDLVTLGKTALVGVDAAGKFGSYNAARKQREAQMQAILAQMRQDSAQAASDAQYESERAAYNERARVANARAAAQTDANRRAADVKATNEYAKAQGKVKESYDPYVKMFARVVPQMEEAYSSGIGSLADLLASAKKERKVRPTDLAQIDLGVK